MTRNATEVAYLASQHHGRLATVAPDGTPQVKPVGFRYNSELASIDIAGFNMESSAKFRNVQANPDVAFVVDDVIGEGASGVRFLDDNAARAGLIPERPAQGLRRGAVQRRSPGHTAARRPDSVAEPRRRR
jgi:PPOX class F420-dependent enzyme/OxyR family protein